MRKASTGLRNALQGLKPTITSTGIAFVNATKTITHTGNGLAAFQPDDILIISGAGQGGNNKHVTVVSVNTNGSSLTVSESLIDEAAGASVTIALANGRAFAQCFKNCIIEIYSGNQPADADKAETGTKLLRLTLNGGAFTPGQKTNGLSWGDPVGGLIDKASGEVWSGLGLATGENTPGWFRIYSNLYVTGESTTAMRLDGSIAASGAQLKSAGSSSIVYNVMSTLDYLKLTLPA